MFVFKPSYRALWMATFGGLAISVLGWIAWNDPAINFLRRDTRAEWIVFPAPVDARAHWFASLDTTFRREFVLANQPRTAHLSVRGMRRAEVKINGTPVGFRPDRDWKKVMTADVAGQLHAGTNAIETRVFNHKGPPALLLTLTTDQLSLRSDESWEASLAGSSWRRAALAATTRTPGPRNSIAGGEHTLDAVKKIWRVWICLRARA